MKKTKVNCFTSTSIQNKLINTISDVFKNDIMREVSESAFILVFDDKSTDVAKKSQLNIFRYIDETKIKERFIRIINISQNMSATDISEEILSCIEGYKVGDKIIS